MEKTKLFIKRLYQKYYFLEKYFIAGAFLLLPFLYYRDILNYWFIIDDTAAIVSSFGTLREIFIENPYSPVFYTPLVALSFKPDVSIFGLNPLPYQ